MFEVPILFLIFNRPETEKRVFQQIKKIKPKYLYVAADGPRNDKPEERKKCIEARKIVDEGVDWDCKVRKLYREKNLGCKYAVSSAIDWFFKNVEQGIILEDDCLPDLSFFNYCELLLDRYSDDKKVMHISGNNFTKGKATINGNYYFSRIPHIWGWATWRRAWNLYDVGMSSFTELKKNNVLTKLFKKPYIRRYWYLIFRKTFQNEIETWDYQWTFAIFMNEGLSITPDRNLVKNIGLGISGTHTTENDPKLNCVSTKIMNNVVIESGENLVVNEAADIATFKNVFDASFFQKIIYFLKKNLWL